MRKKPIYVAVPRWLFKLFTDRVMAVVYPWILSRGDLEQPPWLHAHEYDHWVDQREVGTIKWIYKYFTNDEFKLKVEVRAIAYSIDYGLHFEEGVRHLREHYDFELSYIEAVALLREARNQWKKQ